MAEWLAHAARSLRYYYYQFLPRTYYIYEIHINISFVYNL